MDINAGRLWDRLQEIGSIGAHPTGGVCRYAWTEEYTLAARRLIHYMEEAGIETRIDSVGNVFGRIPGEEDLPAILTGSHLDTVPHGGYFDGHAGVMAALEAAVTLRENGFKNKRPIEIVAFINEEASQYLGGQFGSRALIGAVPSDYPDTCLHRETKVPLKQAMLECGMGLDPANLAASRLNPSDYYAFLELHIEQGRFLLDSGLPMAVVTDIAGIKQFYLRLKGVSAHAGGMAMKDRHDTMPAAAAIACHVERLALTSGSDTRGTVGYIKAKPGEHNIIAEESYIPVDFREASDDVFEKYYRDLMELTAEECRKRGLTFELEMSLDSKPVHCGRELVDVLEKSASERNIPHTKMVSFPSHDAVQIAKIMPVGMIFLRSGNEGLSHCPQEFTSKEDLAAGTSVLLDALISLSGGKS